MVMAEIHQGGPMAHQLPLHNHRGGLVQPSLVMNHHHLDMDCHQTGLDIHVTNISKKSSRENLQVKTSPPTILRIVSKDMFRPGKTQKQKISNY